MSDMHSLQEVLPCINKFLKTCNIEEIKFKDLNCDDGGDVTKAVKTLCADLNELCNTENAEEEPDSSITQITASDKELRERIKAFMKYSQSKIDEQNVKEFCSTSQPTQEWGCARTDSTYKRRSSHTTHIEVTKVVNSDGPQLKFTNSGNCIRSRGSPPRGEGSKPPGPVEERLQTIESHLKINSNQASDVYFRIKNLEDRLLAMEGSSPEYNFRHFAPAVARQTSREKNLVDYSLEEIDDRVRQLKQSLLAKKRKVDEELSRT